MEKSRKKMMVCLGMSEKMKNSDDGFYPMYQQLDNVAKNVEPDVLKRMIELYPVINLDKTLFIVPSPGIDDMMIPVFTKNIYVHLALQTIMVYNGWNIKFDYSPLLDIVLLRKEK